MNSRAIARELSVPVSTVRDAYECAEKVTPKAPAACAKTDRAAAVA